MISPADIKILIAEDEPDLRELLAAKFSVFGFRVDTAPGGHSAWEKVQNDEPSVVVTDIRMPEGSGFELLQNCKGLNVHAPKVFIISAFSDHPKYQIFHAGAEGFMNKPFNTKLLLDVVRKSLLSSEERWRAPSSTSPKTSFEFKTENLKNSIEKEELLFGRGGLCLKYSIAGKYLDQLVSFKIQIEDKILSGSGIPRWLYPDVSDQDDKLTSEYMGLEVVQLLDNSLKDFIALAGDALSQKPYLPCPKYLLDRL